MENHPDFEYLLSSSFKFQAGAGPTFPIRVLLDISNLFSVDHSNGHAVSIICAFFENLLLHCKRGKRVFCSFSTFSITHKGIFVFLVLGWRRGRRKGQRPTIRDRQSTRELTLKESTKEVTRQLTRESTKGLTREFAKEPTKGLTMESTKESTRELTRQLTIEFAEGKAKHFSNRSLNTL